MSAVAHEISLTCADGMVLAGQSWKVPATETTAATDHPSFSKTRILLCHGWLDNCRTYWHLGPALATALPMAEIVALDLPGHGQSSHKSLDGPPAVLAEAVYYMAEAMEQLEWTNNDSNDNEKNVILVGHSMGAALSCLYAAAFTEQIQAVVLLDGVGPLARNPADVAQHVRQHVSKRLKQTSASTTTSRRVYPSLEAAVETRCQTARNFPGNQWLSEHASRELVSRATEPVENGIQFRHDARLQWPSLLYFTMDQTESLYQQIQCPVLLCKAADGWPFDEAKTQRAISLLQPAVYQILPGSHHFHADPDTCEAVSDQVISFLKSVLHSNETE